MREHAHAGNPKQATAHFQNRPLGVETGQYPAAHRNRTATRTSDGREAALVLRPLGLSAPRPLFTPSQPNSGHAECPKRASRASCAALLVEQADDAICRRHRAGRDVRFVAFAVVRVGALSPRDVDSHSGRCSRGRSAIQGLRPAGHAVVKPQLRGALICKTDARPEML
jgi:hypothetical protein